MKRRTKLLTALFAPLAFLTAVGGAVALAIGPISDSLTLSHADPAMLTLAQQAGMSRKGELVFLRTLPRLVSDSEMQSVCAGNTAANNSNGFIEQGCYDPSANRIYIRKMPADLQKLEISTAAYEMLHPVYLAMHVSKQGAALDQAIETNYQAISDPQLTAQVANFAKTEPGARDLELFSLLGTGYLNLTDALASYYKPYFANISATVTANKQVEQIFNDDKAKLDTLKSQIEHYASLAGDAYSASVRWARAGSQYWDDYYYNIYRQDVDQQNDAVNQYNQFLVTYNALVTEYNGTQPVQQLNSAQTQTQ